MNIQFPSFIYRTMAGFFEDDSLGFLWMVLGLVFFVRAMRDPSWSREKIIDAVLAGVFFSLMVFTWSAYNMLIPILLGVGVVQFLLWLRENELEKAKNYAKLWIISFGLLAITASVLTGTFWLSQFGSIVGLVLLKIEFEAIHTLVFIVGLLLVMGLFWYLKANKIKGSHLVDKIYLLIVLALVLSPLIIFVFNVNLQTSGVLSQTIGEESAGKNFFGNKYSYLILFAFVGIPAMGYLLLRKSKQYSFMAIPLVWLIVTFFMAWGKLKFTYYLNYAS